MIDSLPSQQVMGYSSKTPPCGAGTRARSKINRVPTSSQTPSHPVQHSEDNKKTKHLGFKAHHVGSSKHLQDNQKAKRLDFTTHQVGSSKHLLEPS